MRPQNGFGLLSCEGSGTAAPHAARLASSQQRSQVWLPPPQRDKTLFGCGRTDTCRTSSVTSLACASVPVGPERRRFARESNVGNNRPTAERYLPKEKPSLSSAPGANGILGRIPGQYIAEAVRLLPPAATTPQLHLEVELDAGPDGKVRFFAERQRANRQRHSHFFWSVYRAEPIFGTDTL